jgi:hypothetical protein
MKPSAWKSRWVPALSVAAVSLAALGTVTLGARAPSPTVAAQRPAADAPVNVVRAPAPSAPAREPCRTCAMGAGRSNL